MHTVEARPENRRRDTRPVAWNDTLPWVRSEAFAEDLDDPAVLAAHPRHNPRPDWKGSDVVLEPYRRAVGRGLAGLFGRGLGGARA